MTGISTRARETLQPFSMSPGVVIPDEPKPPSAGTTPALIVEVSARPSGCETATTRWNGRDFTASSSNGAILALCRLLLKAGCPEATRWEVPRRISGTVGSVAKLTVSSDMRFARWKPWRGGKT
jgi:hypothetical protein